MTTASYARNSQPPIQRIELLQKLMARALDPSAMEGEAVTSATMFVRVARKDGVTFNRMSEFFAPLLPPPARQEPAEPPGCGVTMMQGRYRGRDLGWIARHDPSYLAWVSRDFSDAFIRDAAEQVVKFFRGEA